MKKIILISLMMLSNPAIGQELIPVIDSPYNLCKPDMCMYYEWEFKSEPSLRYIASGYEDGIDYSIQRVNEEGRLELLFRVNPIVKDNDGKYWWGYPWSTHDLPIKFTDGTLQLYAAIEHKVCRDGNISIPEWQKTLPALLLHGEHGKWNLEQISYEYKLYTIEELVVLSRSERANEKGKLEGDYSPCPKAPNAVSEAK